MAGLISSMTCPKHKTPSMTPRKATNRSKYSQTGWLRMQLMENLHGRLPRLLLPLLIVAFSVEELRRLLRKLRRWVLGLDKFDGSIY